MTVLSNMLEAHTEAYHLLKSQKNGEKSKIGMVIQYQQFDAQKSPIDLGLTQKVCSLMNWAYNDLILEYFKEGMLSLF
jgi:beta-glucosidase/6-phospho-beta-glucosidase/beta-galactosidase